MIYRPVRERSPASIVESVIGGVERAGYDETSLTSLSTADYSCITPLVTKVMGELAGRKVSLSVSSLRAYGLGDEILDQMASSRITGLTFAPEAGTQRMRDVVNKNVTEEHVEQSAERVFQRGWNRLKLYFMIGLPTETDEDVLGIAGTGDRMLAVGRRHVGKRAEVTISVSSHVPKPHTPFQWCAQDPIEEIARKQALLRGWLRERRGGGTLKLKVHDRGVSYLEGVLARGDRRLGPAIEEAWRRGARFDGWDERFDLDLWEGVFADLGIDTAAYHDTRPVTARLPWDHIDVGLEDGFLLREYRKALADRLSPPCGKVRGQLVHHANLRDAEADPGRLVCYDCGVACDLSNMRRERLGFLTQLGAREPRPATAPVRRQPSQAGGKRRPQPQVSFPERPTRRFRIRYTKLGRAAFLGHLDAMRVLSRLFRRAQIEVAYSRGFHPKPSIEFAPALSLGVASFGELLDVSVETAIGAAELGERLREVSPEGIAITGAWEIKLPGKASRLGRLIEAYDLAIAPAADGMRWDRDRLQRIADRFLAAESASVSRGDKTIDVRALVSELTIIDGGEAAAIAAAAGWEAEAVIRARVAVSPLGSAKPAEVAEALGIAGPGRRPELARLAFVGKPGLIPGDPAPSAGALELAVGG
jgi:radical SAM-linked protein